MLARRYDPKTTRQLSALSGLIALEVDTSLKWVFASVLENFQVAKTKIVSIGHNLYEE